MLRKIVPALLCLLMLASPLTAFAADGDVQVSAGTSYTDSDDMVSVTSITETSGGGGVVGRLYYPTDIQTIKDDDEKLIIKTFEVPAGLNPQLLVEESFERNGVLYEPLEILKRALPGAEETRHASTTVTVESKTNDMAALLKLFEPLLVYNEDGFTGQLQLDRDSIIAEAVGYSSYRYPITEVREMSGMERNDTYYIPKTATKNGISLSLSNVSWVPMGYGAAKDGLTPNLFTAKAEYTGYATGQNATGYSVTAAYSGQVSKISEGNAVYSIIYSQPSNPVTEILPDFELEAPTKQFGAITFIIIACVVALGIIGAVIIIWVKRRGPIPADDAPVPNKKQIKKIFMPRSMAPTGGNSDEK